MRGPKPKLVLTSESIDSELAAGKIPDYPKYSKKTIIESRHFQEVYRASQKRWLKETMEDPEKRKIWEDAQNAEKNFLHKLKANGIYLKSSNDLAKEPNKYSEAIPLLLEEIRAADAKSHGWSLLLASMKPKQYTEEIYNLFKELLMRPDCNENYQNIFQLTKPLRSRLRDKLPELKQLQSARSYGAELAPF